VDVAGASRLRWRLEQQAHWRRALAVQEGRQPASDPDVDELEQLDDDTRYCSSRTVHGVQVQLCKRLRAGVWVTGTVAASGERGLDVAKVA
jgi:hypothetical protein